MALVAIHAVVNIPAHVGVAELGSVVIAVATRALEDRVVVSIRVASRADSIRVAVIGWKPRIVECRTSPRRGGMARSTGRRESCRRVIWVRCVLVVGLMASVTIGRQSRVVVVYVT